MPCLPDLWDSVIDTLPQFLFISVGFCSMAGSICSSLTNGHRAFSCNPPSNAGTHVLLACLQPESLLLVVATNQSTPVSSQNAQQCVMEVFVWSVSCDLHPAWLQGGSTASWELQWWPTLQLFSHPCHSNLALLPHSVTSSFWVCCKS